MDERRAVQSAYDEMADAYAERAGGDSASDSAEGYSVPEPVERFRAELGPEDRLLDAGCGQGEGLVAVDASAVGLDFSREQLERARERTAGIANAELLQGDMTALPHRENAFDAVAAIYSLIHVPLEDHRTVIEEFARVLRPGGTLLVTEGSEEWVGSNPDWLDSGTEMRWSIAGEAATREELGAAGFEVRGVWDVPDPTTEDGSKPFFLADLA